MSQCAMLTLWQLLHVRRTLRGVGGDDRAVACSARPELAIELTPLDALRVINCAGSSRKQRRDQWETLLPDCCRGFIKLPCRPNPKSSGSAASEERSAIRREKGGTEATEITSTAGFTPPLSQSALVYITRHHLTPGTACCQVSIGLVLFCPPADPGGNVSPFHTPEKSVKHIAELLIRAGAGLDTSGLPSVLADADSEQRAACAFVPRSCDCTQLAGKPGPVELLHFIKPVSLPVIRTGRRPRGKRPGSLNTAQEEPTPRVLQAAGAGHRCLRKTFPVDFPARESGCPAFARGLLSPYVPLPC
ncbi:hypothetical protein SKAU_G00317280 [Synaphobranchus kaupii]|uniref:Uncharacterized protein n=1 Tax=Synaphobranchus kaupii TaxID=118154 RepID=A0A9Q1ET28_SYNKA|nr:hypothetical protein SKAU_G00317280 [Synaphobranchus kaupii]